MSYDGLGSLKLIGKASIEPWSEFFTDIDRFCPSPKALGISAG
jgi:hypothetical protein